MNKNLTALILIVVAVGIYFTMTKSILAEANAVKASNQEFVTALKNAEEIAAARDKINSEYEKIPEDAKENLNKMIPSTVDNIRLIIDLNSLAQKHGFALSDIKASTPNLQALASQNTRTANVQNVTAINTSGPLVGQQNLAVNAPTLDKVTVTFTTSGGYAEFRELMKAIEANIRIMEFTQLTVTQGDSPTKYNYSVELQTYWLRQ